MDDLFPDERLRRRKKINLFVEYFVIWGDLRVRSEKSEMYDGVISRTVPGSERMGADCHSSVMAYLFSLVREMIRHDRTKWKRKVSEPRRARRDAYIQRGAIQIYESDLFLAYPFSRENWHSIALLESRVKSVGCTRARGLTRHVRAANLLCVTRYRNRRSFVSDSRSLVVLRDVAAVIGINFRLQFRRNLGFTLRKITFLYAFFSEEIARIIRR